MSFDTPNPPFNASDPYATYVNASCFDFLLIELVPLAARTSAELALRDEEWVLKNGPGSGSGSGSGSDTGGTASLTTGPMRQNGHSDAETIRKASGAAAIPVDDESREALHYRLDMLGYRVGLAIAERFSRDRPRFTEPLDVIKFLCKDLWTLLFRKQIDNLKTNHRGVYVLTDNTFKPLSRMSFDKGQENSLSRAQPFLYFPAGIIRGALASMGITANVNAQTAALPGAEFQIRTTNVKI